MEDLIAVLTSWSVQFMAALVFLYVLLKSFKTVRYTAGKRPPGPPSLPLIGHLHHLLFGLPHHSFIKIAEKYGPIVWLEVGALRLVVVTSSDIAREVLKTQDHIFASRPPGIMTDMVFSKGQDLVFSPLNDNFRRARKVFTTELFSQKRIDSFKDLRRDMTLRTLRTGFEEGHANRYITLADLLHKDFLNLTTRMLFRMDMDGHAQTKDLLEIIYDIMHTGWFVIEEVFPLLKPLDLSRQVRRLKNIGERYSELMDSIIDNRLKENSNSKSNTEEDLLDVLLAMSNVSRDQVKVLLLDIIVAGAETSPDTIVWAITEILRHPNIMERLQSELDDVIGKERLVEEADLKNLEYLQAVVKETLRLHPVVGLGIPHFSTEATKVSGYDIPANTRLMVNLYAIGRDAKVWENPLKFDPSRFLNSPVDVRGHHHELLPFGAGRRRCPGMNLALVSVAYNIAQLIHACTISLPEGLTHLDVDVEEKFGMTVARGNPLNLLIKRRLPLDVYRRAGLQLSGV
ncbi:protein MpCYP829-like14 [Marchantia polymorpha subsp. ruderalis]